jgi:hypothetical protein
MWIPDDRAEFHVVRQKGDFDQTVEVVETPGENQMVHMLDDFAAAVRDGRECEPDPTEAGKTGRVMDALLKSAKDGNPVTL